MAAKLPQSDTLVSYCWLCRKYHAVKEYWCPKNVVDRVGTWLFENAFEVYFKVGVAAIFAALLYTCAALLFDWPPILAKPARPPVTEETINKVRELTRQ